MIGILVASIGTLIRGLWKIIIRNEKTKLMEDVMRHLNTVENNVIGKIHELEKDMETTMKAHAENHAESKMLNHKYSALDERLDRLHDALDNGFKEVRTSMQNFELAIMKEFNRGTHGHEEEN